MVTLCGVCVGDEVTSGAYVSVMRLLLGANGSVMRFHMVAYVGVISLV